MYAPRYACICIGRSHSLPHAAPSRPVLTRPPCPPPPRCAVGSGDFLELMVSPTMAWDHFPDRYFLEISRLYDTWR